METEKSGAGGAKLDRYKNFSSYVEDHPIEIYIDYRDELSNEQISKVLEGKEDEVFFDIEDNYYFEETHDDYWNEMAEELGVTREEIDEWYGEEGFSPSENLTAHGWDQLIRNSSAYISVIVDSAEWNFNNWAYGHPIEYRDVKVALKLLGVNPKEYRDLVSGGGLMGAGTVKGYFPDMPNRVPKVNTRDLFDNMIVLYDGVMTFALGDLENAIAVLGADTKYVTFKKGTNVVMYDWGSGAGITDVELIADLTIPRKLLEFRNDNDFRYGMQACYGFTSEFWNAGTVVASEKKGDYES